MREWLLLQELQHGLIKRGRVLQHSEVTQARQDDELGAWNGLRHLDIVFLLDRFVMLAIGALFFVLAFAYTKACDRL